MYADCIRAYLLTNEYNAGDVVTQRLNVDWTAINAAVVARWPKGLEYIKTKAWKLVRQP